MKDFTKRQRKLVYLLNNIRASKESKELKESDLDFWIETVKPLYEDLTDSEIEKVRTYMLSAHAWIIDRGVKIR